jgi:hypothetical protein
MTKTSQMGSGLNIASTCLRSRGESIVQRERAEHSKFVGRSWICHAEI